MTPPVANDGERETRDRCGPPGPGLFAVIAVLVAACYGHAVPAFFVADDFNILNIVKPAQTVHEATGIAAGWVFFRPLTALSYWWTYLAFGMEPIAFHLFDVAFHALNAWLVGVLAWQLLPRRRVAPVAALCFAVLPTGAECVTWIAGRFDVLCVTGSLVCITGYVEHLRRGGPGPLIWTCTGFVIALLAKDTGMILPGFLLFLALLPIRPGGARVPGLRARPRKHLWVGAAVLGALFVGYLALRLQVLGGFGGYPAGDGGGSAHLQLHPLRALAFVRDAIVNIAAPGTGVVHSVAAATAVVAAATWATRIRIRAGENLLSPALPLIGCFFIALLPAANTVTILPNGEGARFLYLPSAFFCVALGIVVGGAVSRLRDSSTRAITVLVLLLIGSHGVTLARINVHWREAGDQAKTILQQIDGFLAKKDYRFLFIHGLPDHHHEAFVFRNGIDTALKLFVSKPIELPPHGLISRADWDKYSALRRKDPTAYPDFLLLRWVPEENRLVVP